MKKRSNGKVQLEKLLRHLLVNTTVTTTYCREALAIMSPASRVKELRDIGVPIVTSFYQQTDSFGVSHKAAQYCLQVEKMSPQLLAYRLKFMSKKTKR